ncbi:MAG: D-alanine--D-alanine ligase [Clostridia bacterium]|nr:D-alanine--D-alanine ligase [Clostridia bacterium]
MKIGVIIGGTSTEREVSLMTGKEMAKNLDKEKYEVYPIIINDKKELVEKAGKIDFALLALHGKFGEDGTVQGTLDTIGIPYSGSGILSSAICMDKDISKRLMRFAGISTPEWFLIKSKEELEIMQLEKLGYPLAAKPNSGGSSIGMHVVKNRDELLMAVDQILNMDHEVILEKYIEGDEITCAILNGRALPILAIKPKACFFDYVSKYTDGGAEEYVVKLDEGLSEKVNNMAERCFDILKCRVYARVDMIIKEGEPYVLEVNTLPGMTKNSLFPKSAGAEGISFDRLLDIIIEYSMNEKVN